MHEPGLNYTSALTIRALSVALLLFMVIVHANGLQGEVWRRVTSGEPSDPVLVHDNGSISIIADDRNLYRFAGDGRLEFRLALRTRNDRLIAGLSDGSVLLSREDGAVTRVSHRGAIAWSLLPTDSVVERAAVSDSGFIVLTYTGGGLRMVTYAGHEIWSRNVGARVSFGPFIDSRARLLLISDDRELLVLGPGGDVRYSYDLDSLPTHAALRPDGGILVAGSDSRLSVIDPDSGREEIVSTGLSGIRSLQVDSSGFPVVLHGETLSRIHSDGTVQRLASGVRSAVVAGEDRYVLVRTESRIEIIDDSGQTSASIRVDESGQLSVPYAGRGGHVVLTGTRWVVYGFQVRASDSNLWTGDAGSGARDYRSGPVRGEDRSVWRRNTEFQFFEALISSGIQAEQQRILEELESRVSSGRLGAAYSYASYVLGILVADSRTQGLVRTATIDMVRRGYELLALIGDAHAHAVIDRAVALYRDEARIEILMLAVADIGYSHRVAREDLLLTLFRRSSESTRVQTSFIEALRRIYSQGYEPSQQSIQVLNSLSVVGGNAAVRDMAREFLRDVSRVN